MPQKKHRPEKIVAKLRQVDILVSQGRSVAAAVRAIGGETCAAAGSRVMPKPFICDRRQDYGGQKTNQMNWLKDPEKDRALEAPLLQVQWRGSGFGKPGPISRPRS
ncbi:MAG: hypothetical protein FJX25_18860 [Alphaproteobacteria bacterium]|nr:hypothetical protein [Alphaproteobacteria bacterium]